MPPPSSATFCYRQAGMKRKRCCSRCSVSPSAKSIIMIRKIAGCSPGWCSCPEESEKRSVRFRRKGGVQRLFKLRTAAEAAPYFTGQCIITHEPGADGADPRGGLAGAADLFYFVAVAFRAGKMAFSFLLE